MRPQSLLALPRLLGQACCEWALKWVELRLPRSINTQVNGSPHKKPKEPLVSHRRVTSVAAQLMKLLLSGSSQQLFCGSSYCKTRGRLGWEGSGITHTAWEGEGSLPGPLEIPSPQGSVQGRAGGACLQSSPTLDPSGGCILSPKEGEGRPEDLAPEQPGGMM